MKRVKELSNKIFDKGIVLIMLIGILALTFLAQYHQNNFLKLTIEKNSQDLVITLPNGKYLELRASSDIIDNKVDQYYRPFAVLNNTQYYVEGLNLGTLSQIYNLRLENNDNSRLVRAKLLENDILNIEYLINTNLFISDDYLYQIQIDYSGEFITENTDERLILKSMGCVFEISKDDDIKYEVFENKSLIFSQSYKDLINFKINFEIDCK